MVVKTNENLEKMVKEVKRNIVYQIMDMIRKKRITQNEFSEIYGTSHQTVTGILFKRDNTSIRTLCRMADVLGCEIEITLERKE